MGLIATAKIITGSEIRDWPRAIQLKN